MLIKIGEEMKVSRLLAAALAAALAASAHAQDEPVSVLYAGGSFGQAHWRPGCAGTSTCEDTDNTVRVFGGYQINRVLAAEVAYTNLGIIGNATSRVAGHAWEAVGLAMWPLAGAIAVYGKLGVFRGKAKSNAGNQETNYGPLVGAGAELGLTRNVALRGEWQHYSGVGGSTLAKSDINAWFLGALWRF